MKLRVADRILVALAGLLILAGCAAVVAQAFFQVDVIGFAARIFTSQSTKARIAVIGGAVFLLLLGGYCFFVLFRHRSRRDKFVIQKNETGELSISIKALENMVTRCLEQHPEIQVQQIYTQNQRDGLLIRLRGSVSGAVSIPLTVEAAQRQIKQYVTACSGVEIKNIMVQIDASGPDAEDAPFRIAPPTRPLLNEESRNSREEVPAAERTEAPAAEAQSAPAAEAPAPAPAPAPEKPMPPVPEDDDDRPLHQRLFKSQPEPCIVPEPPAEPAQPVSEEQTPVQNEAEIPAAEGQKAEDIRPEEIGPEEAGAADIRTAEIRTEEAGTEEIKAEEIRTEEIKVDGTGAETADKGAGAAPEEMTEAELAAKKAAAAAFEAAQSAFDKTLTDKE